ncbi:mucin-2 isoform X3 [Episyrphus balteatus]|uniref:mucin-2 isoform X2 n=1 Tax=Episyrphus balteatus TaxID=286459 RepID=UPI002485D6E1|nr:mucin-2 isoform X2 [Episyrphus balteatus]XP_055856285.1 mucin-2 isoform X3 [Episyrphus balteatus]
MIHHIMCDRQPYWILLPILIWICSIGYGISQSQNAIGRHRNFPKTSFTCTGRPAGYYADIETGCQVYHMCDGLGRQFSYSCPNTTLFQQRMLICDHWYMVNCSKAEMDYAANLLIGQRDKPFVPDEENHLRTPRPDLLDRPYAPDYSGESFRNQFKQLPAVQNSITDFNERKNLDKTLTINHPSPTPTRWKIPQPSREILPPAPPAPSLPSLPLTTRRPPVVASPAPRPQTSTTHFQTVTTTTPVPFIVNRQSDTSDELLGTAHSTRYNTSGDNSAEDKNTKSTSTKPPAIKTPSRIYEPPFLYPIYNMDDAVQSTEIPLQSSTAAPFTVKVTTTTTSTTTPRPPTRPTTLAGKPFTVESTTLTAAASKVTQSTDSALDYSIPAAGAKTFPLPSPFSAPKAVANSVAPPSRELLPPLSDIILHDVATTQGPPIYFEWKIPSNGLEPPKFESPIGVDGREEQDAPLSYTPSSEQVKLPISTTAKSTTPNTNQYAGNPFLSNKTQRSIDSSTSRTPTSRSIKNFPSPGTEENKISPTLPTEQDINQLRMDFSVPDYLFPLENIGRTGYEHSDTFNSFQLKIPQRRVDVEAPSADRWYGENPKCPQCHPSFVKPGTCEPCLRR